MKSEIQDPKSKMNPEPIRILILDDAPTDAELVKRELGKTEIVFTSKWVDNREAFLQELEDFAPDIVLSDYSMPRFRIRQRRDGR